MERTNTFGYWLGRQRRALDLTQHELAQRVGCALGTIKSIETDARRPSKQLAERLARSLHIADDETPHVLAAARFGHAPTAPILGWQGPANHPATVLPLPTAPTIGEQRQSVEPQLSLRPAPHPISPLIGREREIDRIRAYVRRHDTRLITLTGSGGIGKTRLAIQVAHAPGERFADRVHWVSLAALRDPGLVIPTIAQTLGLREVSLDAVASAIGAAALLLVLDNFEHLLAAAPDLSTLLSATPDLTVLLTSRTVLRIAGEHRIVIPPLSVPAADVTHTVAQLSEYAAVEFFCTRARSIHADFVLTAANSRAVSAICTRLGGVPLAIELVAARTHVLSPAALLQRLRPQLAFLVGGPQDAPIRQQTMRATIDWSYTLLDAAEQRAFRRLGAFVGGWNLASAAAVIGCGPCLETITALVDKSLVYQINQPERTADDEPRFTMLETLREYAIEQLTRHGDAAETYAEHAAYFLTLAERARPQLDTDSAPAWVAQLACEHDNLRAALTWSVATPNRVELGARLAHLLISFWWRTEHLHEAQRWLELLLANSGKSVAAIRAALLRDLASVVSPLGNHRAAQAWLEESLALAQELDDKPGIGTTLHLLSEVAFTAGDSRRGVALAEEALPLLRASGDAATVAGVLDDLARDALHTGETTRGVALLEESLALLRTHGPAWDVADTLETLAKAVRDAGDAPRALRLYQEALRQMQRVGSSSAILGVLASLIPALHEQGDQEAAAMYLRESLSRFGELTPVVADPDALPWQRRNIAHAAYVIGDEACAAALLRVSLQTFSQQPVPARGGIALALQDVAGLLICRGQVAQAVELFGAAQMLQTHVAPWGLGERREYERDVARVRAQLGEESFARAWASGVRLSLEDAIAKAIHALVEDSF